MVNFLKNAGPNVLKGIVEDLLTQHHRQYYYFYSLKYLNLTNQ